MSPRVPSLVRLAGLLGGVLLACNDDPGGTVDPASSGCEPNPELTLGTQSQDLEDASGDTPESNGVRLNGVRVNGVRLNGVRLNGVKFNGVKINGVKINGVKFNGVKLNGVKFNGVRFNGVKFNGVRLNGDDLMAVHLEGAAINELVGTTPDGRTMGGEAMVGATLPAILADGSEVDLEIAGLERSADGTRAYYRLEYQGASICPAGETGLFLPGVWDETGARHDELGAAGGPVGASYSCKSGVLAKCVDWGYAPWSGGADVHQTCTRMARADYCGKGTSFTRDGTAIDVYDTLGVQTTTGDASMRFEAAWGPSGALCVSRPRYDARRSNGDVLLPSCWSSLPRCDSLEEASTRFSAQLGNSSRIQSRAICATP